MKSIICGPHLLLLCLLLPVLGRGAVICASVTSGGGYPATQVPQMGTVGAGPSSGSSISANARYVAFISTGLSGSPNDQTSYVYLRNLVSAQTTQIAPATACALAANTR